MSKVEFSGTATKQLTIQFKRETIEGDLAAKFLAETDESKRKKIIIDWMRREAADTMSIFWDDSETEFNLIDYEVKS